MPLGLCTCKKVTTFLALHTFFQPLRCIIIHQVPHIRDQNIATQPAKIL